MYGAFTYKFIHDYKRVVARLFCSKKDRLVTAAGVEALEKVTSAIKSEVALHFVLFRGDFRQSLKVVVDTATVNAPSCWDTSP